MTVTIQPGGLAYTIGSNPTANVVIRDKPFDAWRHANFAALGEENASASDPHSDPDHDGLVNRLEFLLGSDPLDGRLTGVLTVQLEEEGGRRWLVLQYWHRGEAKALNPAVQFSASLGAWTNAPGAPETLFHEPSTGDRLLRHAEDVTDLPRMFLRLALDEFSLPHDSSRARGVRRHCRSHHHELVYFDLTASVDSPLCNSPSSSNAPPIVHSPPPF